MRNMALALFLGIALLACAPDNDEQREKQGGTEKKTAVEQTVPAVKPSAEATAQVETAEKAEQAASQEAKKTPEPVSPQEYEHAGSLLQYANQARETLEENLAGPASHMRANVAAYLDTWRLKKLPRAADRKGALKKLAPPEGLFSPEEEKSLTHALQGMDKALSEMERHYLDLSKYAKDSSIRDDGKQGQQLGRLFTDSYEKFAANQHSWLEIVEKRAEEAEEKFLRAHPLQRQIAGARNIFAQFREIAALINSGSASMPELAALRQTISSIAAECAKPPFNASPALERLYRSFLTQVNVYCKTLDQAMAEGLHDLQKRELNAASNECRKVYNEFARHANYLANNIPTSVKNSRENGD